MRIFSQIQIFLYSDQIGMCTASTREIFEKNIPFYPDLLYKPGRKKVLQHFLSMERIFKTEQFFSRFEDKARKNLLQEFETLSES